MGIRQALSDYFEYNKICEEASDARGLYERVTRRRDEFLDEHLTKSGREALEEAGWTLHTETGSRWVDPLTGELFEFLIALHVEFIRAQDLDGNIRDRNEHSAS